MKSSLVLGLMMAFSGPAFAGFGFTNAGPVSSNGPAGNAVNGVLTYNHTGGAFLPGSITLTGDLTPTNAGTWANEARIRITNPAGQTWDSPAFTPTNTWTGVLTIGPSTLSGLAVLNGNSVGTWEFRFFESFDDGGDLLEDSSWTNLNITINDYVPTPPPASTNLGTLLNTSTVYDTPEAFATHLGGALTWYRFTLTGDISNAAGTWLDIDTETSDYDTEIGLYTATGALIASDDDDGSGLQSCLTFGQTTPTRLVTGGLGAAANGRDGSLVAGTYYIAVAGFNATFAADFTVTTTSTNTIGINNLNIRLDLPTGPVTYCTGGTTTNGCVASISATANPSASFAAPCQIDVTNVEGNKSGLIFYSISGQSTVAWNATSFLCVKSPTQRTPTQTSTGSTGLCDGTLVLDWNAYQTANPGAVGNPWSSGDVVQVQAWFRDPPAGKSTNLSNAIEMTYLP